MSDPTIDPSKLLDDDIADVEDEGVYNFRDMYDLVVQHKDVIFTIASADIQILRTGLAVRKNKDNTKLRNAGLAPESSTLSFNVYPTKDKDGKDSTELVDVRVKLGPRKGVKILNVTVPDNEL